MIDSIPRGGIDKEGSRVDPARGASWFGHQKVVSAYPRSKKGGLATLGEREREREGGFLYRCREGTPGRLCREVASGSRLGLSRETGIVRSAFPGDAVELPVMTSQGEKGRRGFRSRRRRRA